MQVSAATFGQRVTLNKTNASLFSVLKDIRKQTGYGFYYDPATISQNQKVSISVADATVEEALLSALKGLNLVYEIDGKIVTIKAKEKPSFLENVIAGFQEIDVSGRVVDADGRGLPGASVSVKGKGGKAVSTGANGSFYLKGVDEDAVLVISFIGYVSKEIKAAKGLGDIVLEQSLSKLDEVQVIAYGTTTQRLSTGNVTTIKADVIEKQPVNNPLLALQGRVPGLFIEQATGFAGTGVKVRIQGQNSLNNGSDPLYVIDGVPYLSQLLPGGNAILGSSGGTGLEASSVGNPLSFINPSDIESIDVLKDADATAIYGSRAAGGAILITTKKGKTGDTRVNFNLQSGWAKVPNKLDLMNSQQYLEMRREAFRNDGIIGFDQSSYGDNDLNGNWDNSRYTDWQKELIGKTAGYQDMNASVSGGNERTSFLIGAGYHRETNVFPGDFSDRKSSVHFNIQNTSVNQKFKIQFSGGYLYDKNQLPNKDLTREATTLAPVSPALYKSDGSINWQLDATGGTTFGANPIGYMYNLFTNTTDNLTSNLMLSYQLLSGLDLTSSFGYNAINSSTIDKVPLLSFAPEATPYMVRTTNFGKNGSNSWLIEPQLTYVSSVWKGRLEILLGATLQQNRVIGSQIAAAGFSNDLVMGDILSATNIYAGSSTNSIYKYNALFGRINYNIQDKYILNFTGRRDGSSRFGPRSQFHNFAALGAAWIFSNEGVIKDNLKFLSFGKLRGSYGTTGNDQIGEYQFLSLFDPTTQQIPYQGIPVYQPKRLSNPNLEWEETRKLQLGLDLGFIKDRILLNANYYVSRSSNQLSGYSLPLTTGFGVITKNQSYKLENSGWELTLSSTNIQSSNFNWKTSVNLTIPKTLLVDYPDIVKSSSASTAIIGFPLSAARLFHFLGVNPATGLYEFTDKNGNPTTTPAYDDKTVIKDLAPKFYGGIQNAINYRSFQLDFLFSFVEQIGPNNFYGYNPGNFVGYGNQPTSVINRWQKPGDIVSIKKYTSGYDLYQSQGNIEGSDAVWSDASYVRLKNVSFSWQLPTEWIRKAHLQSCNLFLQGQNLWTITSYSGLDPETKSSYTLPPLRIVTLGLKIGL